MILRRIARSTVTLPAMRTFTFNKIIRDDIYEKLERKCIIVDKEHLSPQAFHSALLDKLQEEVGELREAVIKDDVQEEVADVLEVLRSLATAAGLDWEEIEAFREAKRKRKGSFTTPIRIAHITFDDNHPDVAYYVRKKHHYPEVTTATPSRDERP